jgi:triosephosphate isomerase
MKYVIGNWKMHTTVTEAVALAGTLEDGLRDQVQGGIEAPEVVICPPFVSLTAVRDILDQPLLKLGAQDCHWEPEGAHTGEISAHMLAGITEYVLLGHSERREAGETDEQVAKKLKAAVGAGLRPVLLVGEQSKDASATKQAVQQLERGLAELEPGELEGLIVGYEPVWDIGGEQAADVQHTIGVAEQLREQGEKSGVRDISVLYGGSVTADNVGALTHVAELNGVLVGHHSIVAKDFLSIIEQVGRGGIGRT